LYTNILNHRHFHSDRTFIKNLEKR